MNTLRKRGSAAGLESFVDQAVSRLRSTPADLALLPPDAVAGSIFSGAAGVAFFLHEAARLRGEGDLLDLALPWCRLARQWSDSASRSDWLDSPRGLLIGEAGVAYVESLLCASRGDDEGLLRAVERMGEASRHLADASEGARRSELVGGAAGIVCATRDLEARLASTSNHTAALASLRRLRESASASLLAAPSKRPTLGAGRWGLAHGVAGELWALLGAPGAARESVRTRLFALASKRQTDQRGLVYWLPKGARPDALRLTSWCGGIAGQTLLWCEAARHSSTPLWGRLATATAATTAALRTPEPSLCCGLAGQSLALQKYADLANDRRFARRAYERLVQAAALADRSSAFLGLWQGTLGIALVALYRLHGERRTPCVETASLAAPQSL